MVEDLSASIGSLASASSFELLSDDSSQDHRVFSEESDDEVVYSISEVSDTEADDEFVVLRRAPQRAQVLATPIGRQVDPKDVPLPLHEEEVEEEEFLLSVSEPDSEDPLHTPSTVDGLVSDLEGFSLTGDEEDPSSVAELATPITVPVPILSGADTAPTSVRRESDRVVAAAGIPPTRGQKLPSLPDRSLLREQLKVATTNLQANNVPVPTSQEQEKAKAPLTEAQKEAKEQKKAEKKAKKAATKEAKRQRKAEKKAKKAAEKAAAKANQVPAPAAIPTACTNSSTSMVAPVQKLPDRSLLDEQLRTATANLQANNGPLKPSSKTGPPKPNRELVLELTEAERLRVIRKKEAKVAKLTAKPTLTNSEMQSKKAAEQTLRAAKASKPTLIKRLTKKVTKKAARKAAKTPNNVASPPSPTEATAKKAANTATTITSTPSPTRAAASISGLGSRGIVDDLSERFSSRISSAASSEPSSPIEGSMYEEATVYIDTFLSNPEARENSACRLALLQALIIELGLASSVLPTSLNAAKDYLKSRVFVNIKEYLSVRKEGLPALQKIMYPSRKALIKHIRKKRCATPLKMVKDSGLQVLLVDCHFH